MMNPHSSPDTPWQTLARHFAGELSASETDELRRWIAADPARSELVEELGRLWSGTDGRQSWDAEAALQQIKQTAARPVRVLQLTTTRHEAEPVWRRAFRVGVRVAATLGLVAGGAALWRAGGVGADAPAVSQVSTPRGQRATLRLADGTEVLLAPASTIRYAVASKRGPRKVYLDGEASFLVTHDEARPFIVETKHGVATDLGTRFVVQAYPDDSLAAVAVAEGKVSLRSTRRSSRRVSTATDAGARGADSLLLVPGSGGAVTVTGRLATLGAPDVQRFLGLTRGRLEFYDTPMSEVAAALGRWYDLEVRLADSTVAQQRLTASFKNEPASEVLRLIGASLGTRIERRGNVAAIYAR